MKGFTLELERHEAGQAGGFYLYRFGETQFGFTQNPDGTVYSVGISNEKYPDIEFYSDDTKDRYYPDRIRFYMPSMEIKSYKDETKFNRAFQYLCEVRSELQRFFEMSKHAKLYWNNHKGNQDE